MKYEVKDFDLTFEAKGLRPLFQGVSMETYMPPESMLFSRDGFGSSYISKKMLAAMREKGAELFSQSEFKIVDDIKKEIDQAYKQNELIKGVGTISIEDVRACFQAHRDLSAVYGYFDNGYLDGAYEAAKTSRQAATNAKLVESYKNVSREDINRIFFEKDGLWDTMLNKIRTRFKINREDLDWYVEADIYRLFDAGQPMPDLTKRKESFAFLKDEKGVCVFLEGGESLKFIGSFLALADKVSDMKEIRGKVANGGANVRAKAFIISADYSDLAGLGTEMDKMQDGDILVSQTTAPELMPAIRKASAIITDIGGMLSHAAITSRELKIPCIIATGNASKILKTGDLVEVDAEKGIVRKL